MIRMLMEIFMAELRAKGSCGGLVRIAMAFAMVCCLGCRTERTVMSTAGSSNVTLQPPSLELTVEQIEPEISGRWASNLGRAMRPKADHLWIPVMVREKNNPSTQVFSRPSGDFVALMVEAAWPGSFEVQNQAGLIQFRGERTGNRAQGTFLVRIDPEYRRHMERILREPPKGGEWLWVVLQDWSLDDIAGYAAADERLTFGQVCRLKNHGVSLAYFKQVRVETAFTAEEVIRLSNHGVPAEFPTRMREAGYRLEAEELVRLRNYGVRVEDAREWKAAGYNFATEQLVRLRNYGVQPAFGRAVRAVLPEASPEELIKLRNYGVSEAFLTEMKAADARFTADDLVQLRNYGVQPAYVVAWRKAGYDFGVPDLVRLRNSGVPADYAAALNVSNRKPMSADMIIRMRQRGLSAEEIKALRE